MRFRIFPEGLDLSAVWAEMVDTSTAVARVVIERPTPAACLALSLLVVAVVLVVGGIAHTFGAPDPLTDPNPWED